MLSKHLGLLCILLTPVFLAGCPMPAPNGNSNTNANTGGSNSNTNTVNANSSSNQNGGVANTNGGGTNQNANAGSNENASNQNQNSAENSNSNENSSANQNTNGGGGTLSDSDRALVESLAPKLKQAMVIPALLVSYATPTDLDFNNISNPDIGSTLTGCPVVSWAAGAIATFGLIFGESPTPFCAAATADGRTVGGIIEIRNYDRVTQRGSFSTSSLTIDSASANLAGDLTVTGGGAAPVLMNGSVAFLVGSIVLEGPLSLDLRRSGSVTINSAASIVRESADMFSIGIENLNLSVVASGSLTPIGGAVVLNRDGASPIRITFKPESAANGTIDVQVGANPTATIQVPALAD